MAAWAANAWQPNAWVAGAWEGMDEETAFTVTRPVTDPEFIDFYDTSQNLTEYTADFTISPVSGEVWYFEVRATGCVDTAPTLVAGSSYTRQTRWDDDLIDIANLGQSVYIFTKVYTSTPGSVSPVFTCTGATGISLICRRISNCDPNNIIRQVGGGRGSGANPQGAMSFNFDPDNAIIATLYTNTSTGNSTVPEGFTEDAEDGHALNPTAGFTTASRTSQQTDNTLTFTRTASNWAMLIVEFSNKFWDDSKLWAGLTRFYPEDAPYAKWYGWDSEGNKDKLVYIAHGSLGSGDDFATSAEGQQLAYYLMQNGWSVVFATSVNRVTGQFDTDTLTLQNPDYLVTQIVYEELEALGLSPTATKMSLGHSRGGGWAQIVAYNNGFAGIVVSASQGTSLVSESGYTAPTYWKLYNNDSVAENDNLVLNYQALDARGIRTTLARKSEEAMTVGRLTSRIVGLSTSDAQTVFNAYVSAGIINVNGVFAADLELTDISVDVEGFSYHANRDFRNQFRIAYAEHQFDASDVANMLAFFEDEPLPDSIRGHRHRGRVRQPLYKKVLIEGKTYEGTEEEIQEVLDSLKKPAPKKFVPKLVKPDIPNIEPILVKQRELALAVAKAKAIEDDDEDIFLLSR